MAYLVTHLDATGFRLFDTQFITPHLASLGAQEVSRATYRARLKTAIAGRADILSRPLPDAGQVLQRRTQTS
jgi:leucyl/phenylalanyl-tRNA--protein transferase